MSNSDFYLDFENKFRGPTDEISRRLKAYDLLLEKVLNYSKKKKILDIGCGRGEWLKKCRELGFSCEGVEKDDSMVHSCVNQNLKIYKGDAIKVLKTLESSQFSIVSLFHVIEHLSHDQLLEVLKESKRLLTNDGILILETPSIDNLTVASRQFFLDPTHISPINPDALIFFLDYLGFNFSKYYFLNPGQFSDKEPSMISSILSGVGQDLSVIACNSLQITNHLFDKNNLIFDEEHVSLSTLEAALKYDQILENKLKQVESLESQNKFLKTQIDSLKTQIDFLTYRQDKIYNMLPLRIIRKIKSSFLSTFIKIKFLYKKLIGRVLIFVKYSNIFCFKYFNLPTKLVYKMLIIFLGKGNVNNILMFFDRLFSSQNIKEINQNSSRFHFSQYNIFLRNQFIFSKRAKHINSLIMRKNRINKGKLR